MKILQTADWHLGPFKGPVDAEGNNLRYRRTIECLQEMIDVAERERPDLVVISGDIFHQEQVGPVRFSQEVLDASAIIEELAKTAEDVIVMRGTPNHDGSGQFDVLKQILCGSDFNNIQVVDYPCVIPLIGANTDVAVLPGFDKQAFRAKCPGLSADQENDVWTGFIKDIVVGLRAQCTAGTAILMAHYTVPGCNTESGQTSCYANFEPVLPREAILSTGFDWTLLGHIHRPQKLENLPNTFYAGAINALNFNDEGQERGFWIHDTVSGESTFHETPHNVFKTIEWSEEDVRDYLTLGAAHLYASCLPADVDGKIIRVRYSCTDAQKKELNIPLLQKDLYDCGAFYVADIEAARTIEVQNRSFLSEESDPVENLKQYLDEKCVKNPEQIVELAEPIIRNAMAKIDANEYHGVFVPKKIAVKNYRAYVEETFDFADASFCAINGVNGAGKSSLFFDAIMDCLFEKTREGDVKAWLRATPEARSGSIEFQFAIGEHDFRVVRTRQKSGRGTLNLSRMDDTGEWVNMCPERSTDVQKEIEKVLGMDYMTFKTCALIMQDQYGLFLEARREDRVAILGNLLGLGIYNLMEADAKDLLGTEKRRIANEKSEIQVRENFIKQKGDPESELKQVDERIAEMTDTRDKAKEALAHNEGELAKMTALEEEKKKLLDAWEKMIDANKKDEQELEAIKNEAQTVMLFLTHSDTYKEKAAAYEQAMSEANAYDADIAKLGVLEEQLKADAFALGEHTVEVDQMKRSLGAMDANILRLRPQMAGLDRIRERVAQIEKDAKEKAEMDERFSRYHKLLNTQADSDRLAERELSKTRGEIEILNTRIAAAKRQAEFLENSNCVDLRNAKCRFLAQAKADAAALPELEEQMREMSESLVTRQLAAQDKHDQLQKMINEVGYNEERHRELSVSVAALRTQQSVLREGEAAEAQIASLERDKELLGENIRKGEENLSMRRVACQRLTEKVNELSESRRKREDKLAEAAKLRQYVDLAAQIPVMEERSTHISERCDELNRRNFEAIARMTENSNRRAEVNTALDQFDDTPDALRATITTLKKNIEDAEYDLTFYAGKKGSLEQKVKDVEEMRKAIAECKKIIDAAALRASQYEILKVAFSQDGVPHQIIRNIVPYIRDKANSILGAMTGGTMGVDFRLERMVKGRDTEKATLDVLIEEYGKTTLPYTSKSGGEKVKASLAVNLSLAEIKMEASGVQIGFLGIDEAPFLDSDGSQAYVDALESIRERYPTTKILAITHDDEFRARFSQMVTVYKDDNGSHIRWE